MSRRDKKLEKWITAFDWPVDEVLSILKWYGFIKIKPVKGSHYRFTHEKLKPNGEVVLTIPVKGGQKVLNQYLIKIRKLIEILEDLGNEI